MTKLRLLALSTLGLPLALVLGSAGSGHATTALATTPQSSASSPCSFFTGTDDTGDFQAALDDAVAQAVAAAPCCDQQISYKLISTSGVAGGFIGDFHVIRVTIQACTP